MKKDEDAGSKVEVNHLEQQIAEKQKEYNDLEETGKLKKHWLRVIKKPRSNWIVGTCCLEKAKREGDLAEAARLQYGVIPELQKRGTGGSC